MQGFPATSADSVLRRLVAAGCTALVLLLAVLAVCPELHHALHGAHEEGDAPTCVVAVFSGGVTAATQPSAVEAPPARLIAVVPAAKAELHLVAPRFLHQPERGPPASLS